MRYGTDLDNDKMQSKINIYKIIDAQVHNMSKETGTNHVYNMYHANHTQTEPPYFTPQSSESAYYTPQPPGQAYYTPQSSESAYYAPQPPRYVIPETINQDDLIDMYEVGRGEVAKHDRMMRDKRDKMKSNLQAHLESEVNTPSEAYVSAQTFSLSRLRPKFLDDPPQPQPQDDEFYSISQPSQPAPISQPVPEALPKAKAAPKAPSAPEYYDITDSLSQPGLNRLKTKD